MPLSSQTLVSSKVAPTMPSVFLSHGAPDLALSSGPAVDYLSTFESTLPHRPKGIVIISAHWETRGLQLTTAPDLETIYDFSGFSPQLYSLQYQAKTAPWLIKSVKDSLSSAGYAVTEDTQRGLDHGAWVPLMLAFPKADIPIVQLSLDRGMSLEELFALGKSLAKLKAEGILIAGSGGLVHNLREVRMEGQTEPSAVPDWAQEFENWLDKTILARDWQSLFNYRQLAPHAVRAHPTDEHLRPLVITLGAGDGEAIPRKALSAFTYRAISMASWQM
ncbi:MAG: dioxygenase [Cohaesibacter sp.]|jgi:4,5-DOPA dioxygenase extradiol|nr:dioxygenase [Cohaesibacter sp.]